MPKPSKKDHALHNEDVCNYLCPNVTYADWVLITAFYSAIHYVDHKIFPITEKTVDGARFKIKCINEYRNNRYPNKDKHTSRVLLVDEKLPALSSAFRWLKDSGHNSRYINYSFSDPGKVIETAKKLLSDIKNICT